ncbi:hypothetical protein NUSPORA_00645 [Nucleospora cyclopteri]
MNMIKKRDINSFAKNIVRKLKTLDYKNTQLNPGFKELEQEYKAVRDDLKMLKNCFNTFKNYEYGNSLIKSIFDGVSYFESKLNKKILLRTDLYSQISQSGFRISKISGNQERKNLANKLKDTYATIADAKKLFNENVKDILKNLEQIKSNSNRIDELRKSIRDTRYDLEVSISEGNYDNELLKTEKKNLSHLCRDCMKQMSIFIKNPEIGDLMKNFLKVHLQFIKRMVSELEKFE